MNASQVFSYLNILNMFNISTQLFSDNNENYQSDKHFVKLLRIDENETLLHEGSLFLFYLDCLK